LARVCRKTAGKASGKSLPLLAEAPSFSRNNSVKNFINQWFNVIGTGCALKEREENL